MSNQVLDLNPKLSERAKAADDAALNDFHGKVLDLAKTFSIKEAARLLRISTGGLRIHAEKHGVTFFDRTKRTQLETRQAKKLWDHYMIHYELRQVQAPARPVQPGDLKITPKLEADGRKALWQGQNVFYERACELAEVFTLVEASKILKVTHRFLKTFAYNEQIVFVGEPSLDVQNEFHRRAVEVAEVQPIIEAAKVLNVTSRFLFTYVKHWGIPFFGEDSTSSQLDADSFDEQPYLLDATSLDDDDTDDIDSRLFTKPPVTKPYFERQAPAYGTSYTSF